MKTITYYELLDLMKKKEAPKNVKYMGFEFYGDSYNYQWCDDDGNLHFLSDYMSMKDMIKEEIEVLEEQKKIPEKLNDINSDFYVNDCYYEKLSKEEIALDLVSLKNWINSIIDYLKSKGE